MHRVDAIDNAAGTFTDDFESTQEGSVVGEDWLNAVQEEIISVLTLAGMEPEKASNTQLAEAISVLVTAVMNNHAALTDAHGASTLAVASRLAQRDAAGKLAGDITGNAATATNLNKQFIGHVAANGAALRLPAGWTVVRLSTGNYRITHNLNNSYSVVLTSNQWQVVINSHSPTLNSFNVLTFSPNPVAALDCDFSFILNAY